jgi:hypothetical protein
MVKKVIEENRDEIEENREEIEENIDVIDSKLTKKQISMKNAREFKSKIAIVNNYEKKEAKKAKDKEIQDKYKAIEQRKKKEMEEESQHVDEPKQVVEKLK